MNDALFLDWKAAEEAAEAILPMVGHLYRDHGIITLVNGTRLVHSSPVEIIQAHRRGHLKLGHDVPLRRTQEALAAVVELELAPVELDVGKLLVDYASTDGGQTVGEYVRARAASLSRRSGPLPEGRDVVLYGFGRIGRILARLLVARAGGGEKYNLRAIIVRDRGAAADDLVRRTNLLRRDSVHGGFEGTVEALPEESALLINGSKVQLISAESPDAVDYTAHGIRDAIVIDNTGKWRDRAGLGKHLAAKGVAAVILTAPGKGDVPNVVFGVNDADVGRDERVISAASCTTNAIVPVLKALHDRYGIVSGHIETVHAYTNDQNLIDNYHKKERRGRSAALNMVITETGAASAAAKALPELAGRLTANAIRVPTPNVSLAIMMLKLDEEVSREDLNAYLHEAACQGPLQDQIGWADEVDTVSSDLVGDPHAGTVDGQATIAKGHEAVVYVWYDNEWGYSCQVLRLLGRVADRSRPRFP